MTLQHPMERYTKPPSPRLGCTVMLVVVGLLAGGLVYLWSTRPPSEASRTRHAMAVLETSEAMIRGTKAATRPAPALAARVTPVPMPAELEMQLASQRKIFFPSAGTFGRIVTARRIPGGWDVAYLQDLVGHLEGTTWLGETGNTVLAGHFEDQIGRPGPFRYLYNAKIGDTIIIQDGEGAPLITYRVTQVFRTTPDDVEVLRNTTAPRLTLITCDSWNQAESTYDERLVVIAEPVSVVAASDNGIN